MIFFMLYTSPIASIMSQHGAKHSAYADDVNALAAVDHKNLDACAVVKASAAVRDWYADNGMLLNASKSEAILIGTRARLSKFDKNAMVTVAGARVKCGETLTTLGVVIDSHLSFDARVNSIVSSCNYHLRAFRHIRPSLTDEIAITVGRSIIMSL